MTQVPDAITQPAAAGSSSRKQVAVGCCGCAVLLAVGGAIATLVGGARKDLDKFNETMERAFEHLQENEAKWQNAAMDAVVESASLNIRGGTAWTTRRTLARSDDGKYLIVECICYSTELPAEHAPRISWLGLVRDNGANHPEVIDLLPVPVTKPSTRKNTVSTFTQRVPGATWTYANE